MRIVIEIVEGLAAGRKKALRAPVVLIVGRSDLTDWSVAEDSAMSSNHFKVVADQSECVVTDLDSTNGTIIDGQRIATKTLQDGDRITAGSTVFQVSISRKLRTSGPIGGAQIISDASPSDDGTVATPNDGRKTAPGAVELPKQKEEEQSAKTQSSIGKAADGDAVSRKRTRPFTGAVIQVCSEIGHGRKSILRSGQSITVGRTELADFVIQDPMLSARHFSVSSTPSGWLLSDLGSSSGTQVGGVAVSKTLLKTGDRVLAGQSEFVVTIGESVPTGASGSDAGIPFQQGVRDEDPAVRNAAITAAAWSGEPWLLEFCREAINDPNPEQEFALRMFCILAQPSDLDSVLRLGRNAALGALRFDFLASFGHPAVVPFLLEFICGEDPEAAVAAGEAFTRITGFDIQSNELVSIGASEDEQEDVSSEEAGEDVLLPDPVKANEFWQQNENRFASGNCFRRGIESSGFPSTELLDQLDMRSRWEVCLRGRYEGRWMGSPFDLERVPIP